MTDVPYSERPHERDNCIADFLHLHYKEVIQDGVAHQEPPHNGRPYCLAVIMEVIRRSAQDEIENHDIHMIAQYFWDNPDVDKEIYNKIFPAREAPEFLPDDECVPWTNPSSRAELQKSLQELGLLPKESNVTPMVPRQRDNRPDNGGYL